MVSPAVRAGLEILPFKPDGYNFWTWRGRRIHYVEQGAGQPIVLIHGFGASAFHWRSVAETEIRYLNLNVHSIGLVRLEAFELHVVTLRDMVHRTHYMVRV